MVRRMHLARRIVRAGLRLLAVFAINVCNSRIMPVVHCAHALHNRAIYGVDACECKRAGVAYSYKTIQLGGKLLPFALRSAR